MPNIHSCRQNVLTLPKNPKVLPHHSTLQHSIAPSKSSPVQSRQVTLLRCGCLSECLRFFLNAVAIKYSDKSNLRKERLTLVHCSRFGLVVTGTSSQQEPEVAGHTTSPVRREQGTHACCLPYIVQDPLLRERACPQLR